MNNGSGSTRDETESCLDVKWGLVIRRYWRTEYMAINRKRRRKEYKILGNIGKNVGVCKW